VYFASPYIAPSLCPPSTLAYDEFVPKVVPAAAAAGTFAAPTYGAPISNVDVQTKTPQPPACSYVALLDEADAKERCSAETKCVGYYKNKTKAPLAVPIQSASSAHVPISERYWLSVAKPNECAVDWQAVQSSAPVCEKLLGKLAPSQGSWYVSSDSRPGPFCKITPTGGSTDGFRAIYRVTTKDGAKCPLGWTARADGQCLPPCLKGQANGKNNDKHLGEWCNAEYTTDCAKGYEKYRRGGGSNNDGAEGFGIGIHRLSSWDFCLPSPKEINAIISQNKP
jgi:hypothetical protein